jgi:hypothetical protein
MLEEADSDAEIAFVAEINEAAAARAAALPAPPAAAAAGEAAEGRKRKAPETADAAGGVQKAAKSAPAAEEGGDREAAAASADAGEGGGDAQMAEGGQAQQQEGGEEEQQPAAKEEHEPGGWRWRRRGCARWSSVSAALQQPLCFVCRPVHDTCHPLCTSHPQLSAVLVACMGVCHAHRFALLFFLATARRLPAVGALGVGAGGRHWLQAAGGDGAPGRSGVCMRACPRPGCRRSRRQTKSPWQPTPRHLLAVMHPCMHA